MSKYNKEQINAMDPEQLKRAVATEVMGLSLYHYDKDVEERCFVMLWDENCDPVARFDGFTTGQRKTEEEAWADCPDFTGDISAAWPLVDKLKIEIVPQEGAPTSHTYLTRILQEPFKRDVEVFSETAPEAICKAALLAVMAE